MIDTNFVRNCNIYTSFIQISTKIVLQKTHLSDDFFCVQARVNFTKICKACGLVDDVLKITCKIYKISSDECVVLMQCNIPAKVDGVMQHVVYEAQDALKVEVFEILQTSHTQFDFAC